MVCGKVPGSLRDILIVSIKVAAASFGAKKTLRLVSRWVEIHLNCVRGLHQTATGEEKPHLFTTFPIFPMLVPQGSKPSLFGGHPLILLERLANSASSDLSVFVVSVVFVFL